MFMTEQSAKRERSASIAYMRMALDDLRDALGVAPERDEKLDRDEILALITRLKALIEEAR